MNDAGDALEDHEVSDKLLQEWERVQSRLQESGHRFNSRFVASKFAGDQIDPEEVLRHVMESYERTAAMIVQMVTDHDSALACVQELENHWKNLLKAASKLLRVVLSRESRGSSSALLAELHGHLLSRSEHWKAEAHKVARLAAKARAKVRNAQSAAPGSKDSGVRARNGRRRPQSDGQRILLTAMERQGLNAPKLATKVQAILKRRKGTMLKADRTTVYRIVQGETKKPQPAIRNAIMEALHLEGTEAAAVRRALGGSSKPSTAGESVDSGKS